MISVFTSDFSGDMSSEDKNWEPPARARSPKTARPTKAKSTRTVKAKTTRSAKPAKAVKAKSVKTAKAKPAKAMATAKTATRAKTARAVKPAAKAVKSTRTTKAASAKAKTNRAAKPAKAVKAKPAKAVKTVKAAAKTVRAASSQPKAAAPKVAKVVMSKAVKEPKRVDGRRRPTKKVARILPLPDKFVMAAIQEQTPSGQAIKNFRTGIEVNMRAFAELLGVNPATVFRWETERTGRIQTSSQQKLKKLVANVINKKPVKIAG